MDQRITPAALALIADPLRRAYNELISLRSLVAEGQRPLSQIERILWLKRVTRALAKSESSQ